MSIFLAIIPHLFDFKSKGTVIINFTLRQSQPKFVTTETLLVGDSNDKPCESRCRSERSDMRTIYLDDAGGRISLGGNRPPTTRPTVTAGLRWHHDICPMA